MKLTHILILIGFFLLPMTLPAQYFGKNKVQYKTFEWYYIQSKHFDVYFYEGGLDIAKFTAEVAESAYVQLSRDFRYEIKDRIVFIVYKSHNDWQQTNVVIEYLEEGIGGVTELFKNRIVVPFEGSYEQFRHVIHHELVHAVMNDMLYGGSIQSLIREEVTPPPLWFSEGLAEFESQGWNTRLDMVVRDATLNGYMPPLEFLQFFLVYQGGASVFKFIAETYGREKIGELLSKMRGRVSFEKVLRTAVGMNYEEFTEKWHRYLRRQYWPDVANRKEPVEFAKRLTNHKKERNYLNVSPAITPNGDKIAFISDRKGYQNIYLLSAIEGKIIKTLVKGQRSESFEELHFLRPGMSFSPDGRKLAFTAKSGPWDAIYIIDIKTDEIEKYIMKLDGAFTTSWSPDGRYIAFVGNKDGQSDIYIFDLETEAVRQITNDPFTDDQPSWSPDSRYIAFVSDRKHFITGEEIPPNFRMSEFDYEKKDIYIVEVETGNIQRITDTEWEEQNPIFSPDGKKLAYLADKNGIFNVFIRNLEDSTDYPITNVISGILQIGWDKNANKMVFTSFYDGGFDIYLMNTPLELPPVEKLEDTQFVKDMKKGTLPVYARKWKAPGSEKQKAPKKTVSATKYDYSRYVFTKNRILLRKQKKKDVTLPVQAYQVAPGQYKVRKYKLKFSPDIITGSAGYNTFFGVQGYTTIAFSDLLGDHKVILNINLLSDLKNSDLNLLYFYLKQRINYGVGGFHLVYFFFGPYGLVRYRNFGATFLMSYPFNRFKRVDFYNLWYNVYLEYLDLPIPTQKVSTLLPSLSFVHDNVLWGYTGPWDGSRYSITATYSPKYSRYSRDFKTLQIDYRKYFMINRDYSFAFRLAAGASFGENAQQFFLGGVDNWINRKFRGGLRIQRIDDIFFSEFVTPLRGAYYYEQIGTRYFLTNLEFRFPLIEYLALGFPKIRFFNIRGVMFYDLGSAWYGNQKFEPTTVDAFGNRRFKDIISGYGIGARVFFLYFLLKIDVAWRFDLQSSSKPLWYFSLGADL